MWVSWLTAIGGFMVILGEVIEKLSPNTKTRFSRLIKWLPKPLHRHTVLTVCGGILVILCAILNGYENAAYQATIETLSNKTYNLVSGGDSYVYISFESLKEGDFRGWIEHCGDYPVYDVRIETLNLNSGDGLGGWTKALIVEGNPRLNEFPAITHSMILSLSAPLEPTNSDATYAFLIHARNRSLLQQTRFVKLNQSTWVKATRVVNFPDRTETIVYKVDVGFPRDDNGKVVWKDIKLKNERENQ